MLFMSAYREYAVQVRIMYVHAHAFLLTQISLCLFNKPLTYIYFDTVSCAGFFLFTGTFDDGIVFNCFL